MIILYVNTPYNIELVVLDGNGKPTTGLLVNYEVRLCSTDAIIQSGVAAEVNRVYTFAINIAVVGEYRIKFITPAGYEDAFENVYIQSGVAGSVWDEQTALHIAVGSFGKLVLDTQTLATLLENIEGGRWAIVGTQMIFYDKSNLVELFRFNLYDQFGALTNDMTKVWERKRV